MRHAALALTASLALLGGCGADEPGRADETRERAAQAVPVVAVTGAERQTAAQASVIETAYVCANGQNLSVVFDNPREMATVRAGNGEAVDLRQERAASGIWYKTDGYELRGKGRDAVWISPERGETTCVATD